VAGQHLAPLPASEESLPLSVAVDPVVFLAVVAVLRAVVVESLVAHQQESPQAVDAEDSGLQFPLKG